MARRDLPVLGQLPEAATPPAGQNGHYGAAVRRARDAYQDVPILQQPTWKYEIAAYFFLGGASGGAAVLGALADLVGGTRKEKLARYAKYVAFAAMLPCPALLILDLGKRSRFHHMPRIFKPASPMNLGAWALLVHGGMTTLVAAHALARERDLGLLPKQIPGRLLAPLSLPPALTLARYTGVLLGTSSIPVWLTSPLLGALFMASAFSSAADTVGVTMAVRDGFAEPNPGLSKIGPTSTITELGLLAGYLVTSGKAARPFRHGRLGAMLGTAAGALLGSAVLDATGQRSGKQRALADVVGMIGSALLRVAIVQAGHASATDREGTLTTMQASKTTPGWGPPLA
jgi:formate-dependent nitrite reductase membrane component NrfD